MDVENSTSLPGADGRDRSPRRGRGKSYHIARGHHRSFAAHGGPMSRRTASPAARRVTPDVDQGPGLGQAQMILTEADTALNPKKYGSARFIALWVLSRPAQFYSGLKGPALKKSASRSLPDRSKLETLALISSLPSELSRGQRSCSARPGARGGSTSIHIATRSPRPSITARRGGHPEASRTSFQKELERALTCSSPH